MVHVCAATYVDIELGHKFCQCGPLSTEAYLENPAVTNSFGYTFVVTTIIMLPVFLLLWTIFLVNVWTQYPCPVPTPPPPRPLPPPPPAPLVPAASTPQSAEGKIPPA